MRRRRSRAQLPTADELVIAPELSILGALDAAIDLALVALVAAQSELQATDDCHNPVSTPAARAADLVITSAQTLAAAIASYRLTRLTRPDERDDLPF